MSFSNTPGALSAANYTITYSNGVLTVTPAPLTLTASNLSKVYGQTLNFAGTEFSVAGLLNSDAVTNATLSSAGSVGRRGRQRFALLLYYRPTRRERAD